MLAQGGGPRDGCECKQFLLDRLLLQCHQTHQDPFKAPHPGGGYLPHLVARRALNPRKNSLKTPPGPPPSPLPQAPPHPNTIFTGQTTAQQCHANISSLHWQDCFAVPTFNAVLVAFFKIISKERGSCASVPFNKAAGLAVGKGRLIIRTRNQQQPQLGGSRGPWEPLVAPMAGGPSCGCG